MLILCIYGFTLLQITFAALFYDPNYLQYNRKYPKCITTCYSPDTGYQTITTYGNRPVYRDSSLNLRGLDLARRYYDKYRSDSRCKYRTDGSSITIIDDSMERTATVSEQSQIETYKRRMRNYNAIHHPAAPRGFTQIYGGGLPFDTETSSAPIPPCFCAYCRVVVVEDY